MPRAAFLVCAGAVGCASGLRVDNSNAWPNAPRQAAVAFSRHADTEAVCQPPSAYRQELDNMMDLQYFTKMEVGGQSITGILDTGSFELVVFSRSCKTCGKAGKYEPLESATFKSGNAVKTHSYGSGSCRSTAGYDEVVLGCYKTPKQSMWLATDCRMPLLQAAGFQSIVGVGPPGQPETTARKSIEQLEGMINETRKKGGAIPREVTKALDELHLELKDAKGKKSLLESFGMSTFSTCLGRKQGSPAWMIWNDITREGQPGVMRVPVVGEITWGIKLEGMSMEFDPSSDVDVKTVTEEMLGCQPSCGAVVDTGTSLLSVPTDVYRAVAQVLEKHMTATDCSDLANFPTFIITVAGHKLRLPPSSYLGTVSGTPSENVAKRMPSLRRMTQPPAATCQLLMMDLGMEQTQFGPMVILGMPLFREYYTTFDLGSGPGHRSILFTPATDSCHPDTTSGKVSYNRNREGFRPRHVDLSMVRLPEWLENRGDITV